MSFEYLIQLDSMTSYLSVKNEIKHSILCNEYNNEYISWKDNELSEVGLYNVRFYIDEDNLIMVIHNPTKVIFNEINSILCNFNYHLIDCDTDENVSIKYIFRSVI